MVMREGDRRSGGIYNHIRTWLAHMLDTFRFKSNMGFWREEKSRGGDTGSFRVARWIWVVCEGLQAVISEKLLIRLSSPDCVRVEKAGRRHVKRDYVFGRRESPWCWALNLYRCLFRDISSTDVSPQSGIHKYT
jgi:hypothetical protein